MILHRIFELFQFESLAAAPVKPLEIRGCMSAGLFFGTFCLRQVSYKNLRGRRLWEGAVHLNLDSEPPSPLLRRMKQWNVNVYV